MGRPKEEQKSTGQTGNRKEKCMMNSGCKMNSGSRKEISQVVKFSQSCKIPIVLHFHAFFTLLSFWFLICNVELDSSYSCLDRLNNFGINILQKLQN